MQKPNYEIIFDGTHSVIKTSTKQVDNKNVYRHFKDAKSKLRSYLTCGKRQYMDAIDALDNLKVNEI